MSISPGLLTSPFGFFFIPGSDMHSSGVINGLETSDRLSETLTPDLDVDDERLVFFCTSVVFPVMSESNFAVSVLRNTAPVFSFTLLERLLAPCIRLVIL